jgi:hypothetical protein
MVENEKQFKKINSLAKKKTKELGNKIREELNKQTKQEKLA